MRKLACIFIILILLFIPVYAESASVVDGAGVLSQSSETVLTRSCNDFSALNKDIGIYMVTVATANGRDIDYFADDLFYKSSFGVGEEKEGIMLLINVGEREYSIYLHGTKTQEIYNSDALTYIEDAIYNDLAASDFSAAFTVFCQKASDVMTVHLQGKSFRLPFDVFLWVVIGAVIGLIVALIRLAMLKGDMRTVRRNDSADGYVVRDSFDLSASRDIYLFRTVTRVYSPKSSSTTRSSSASGGSFTSRSGKF